MDVALRNLRDNDYDLVEQRFPRRAYVVVGYPEVDGSAAIPLGGSLSYPRMKRRGLRVTLTAGAIGLAVVAGVVVFNWDMVRTTWRRGGSK